MFPLPSFRKNDSSAGDCCTQPFSLAERRFLLDCARRAIAGALEGVTRTQEPCPGHLAEKRGAFCTLYLDGQLRGCVGQLFPLNTLCQTVAETARAAAFDDPRFPPITAAESSRLKISISVLSSLKTASPEQVEVGKHGLLVSQGNRRGVLLPQVPGEHGWDCRTFLEQTCLKAGLPAQAWQTGAKLEIFTAEIIADDPLLG